MGLIAPDDKDLPILDALQSVIGADPNARIYVRPIEIARAKPEEEERKKENEAVAAREALYAKPEKSAMLPSTAAAGLLFGHGRLDLAAGAALLLAVNVVCVNLACKLVFLFKGIAPRTWLEKRRPSAPWRSTSLCGSSPWSSSVSRFTPAEPSPEVKRLC